MRKLQGFLAAALFIAYVSVLSKCSEACEMAIILLERETVTGTRNRHVSVPLALGVMHFSER